MSMEGQMFRVPCQCRMHLPKHHQIEKIYQVQVVAEPTLRNHLKGHDVTKSKNGFGIVAGHLLPVPSVGEQTLWLSNILSRGGPRIAHKAASGVVHQRNSTPQEIGKSAEIKHRFYITLGSRREMVALPLTH